MLGFVLYDMAVSLDTNPSGQVASMRLCCDTLIYSVYTPPEPLLSASYCALFCCTAGTTAWFIAAVSSHSTTEVEVSVFNTTALFVYHSSDYVHPTFWGQIASTVLGIPSQTRMYTAVCVFFLREVKDRFCGRSERSAQYIPYTINMKTRHPSSSRCATLAPTNIA